jgi:hypothetical protein
MAHTGSWFIDEWWKYYRETMESVGISKGTVVLMKSRYYSDLNDHDLSVTLKVMKEQYPAFMEEVAKAAREIDVELEATATLDVAKQRLAVAKVLNLRLSTDPLADGLGRLGHEVLKKIGAEVGTQSGEGGAQGGAQGGGHRSRRRRTKRRRTNRKSKRRRTKRRRSR